MSAELMPVGTSDEQRKRGYNTIVTCRWWAKQWNDNSPSPSSESPTYSTPIIIESIYRKGYNSDHVLSSMYTFQGIMLKNQSNKPLHLDSRSIVQVKIINTVDNRNQ
jgi:hypothetical protein